MPVSMELRQEHRKLALAIVVAMDRSGSMSMTVAAAERKCTSQTRHGGGFGYAVADG